MKKIILIEFNDFHEEVLLSQIHYLKEEKNTKIYLYINEKLESKFDFQKLGIEVFYIRSRNKFTKILSIFKILKTIKKEKINYIVFNTFESLYVSLIKNFLKSKKKYFIVHNLDKFKCIKGKNNSFLVLSKTLKEYGLKTYKKCYFDYFYPLVRGNEGKDMNKKEKHKLTIVVPGLIELSRRDYLGLLESIKDAQINNIEFVFLGNIEKLDGPLVMSKIKEYKLEKLIKTFKNFIPYEKYFSIIKESDLIMPLIHPNIENFEKYHRMKITAAFTMSFSFQKPLFLYKSLSELEEFNNIAISYDKSNLVKTLKSLDKRISKDLENKIKNKKEFSWEYQKNRYKRIIFE